MIVVGDELNVVVIGVNEFFVVRIEVSFVLIVICGC